ncbi:hypothetical protein [Methylorubrum extorquens]|nr:hypothetical protein [Methylorubrum extorquens]
MAITVSNPDAFFDVEPWGFHSTLGEPGWVSAWKKGSDSLSVQAG